MTTSSPLRRVRPVTIAPAETVVRHGPDGTVYMQSPHQLGDWVVRLTSYPDIWAHKAPEQVFLAQRSAEGWRTIRYGETARRMRSIAQALLDRRLSADRPVLILSGNSIDHALLALASMHVGVPYAPIAPAYSLQSRDFATLRQIVSTLQPGLVFAEHGAPFADALRQAVPPGTEIVVSSDPPTGVAATLFHDVQATRATDEVDQVANAVDEHATAKVLFTSGSTGRPKGVINTHRMLSSNQSMIRQTLPFLEEEPPVLCDWSPWNHTAGGNHNFGLILVNGGTLYIDEGKPTPALFDATLRNLREIACTAHFAIPRTYELLMPHLRSDAVLRETFFRKLKLIFYAAAGLGQKFWDELRDLSIDATGEEIVIMTGFGCTETAPFAFCTGSEGGFAGLIGLPSAGLEVKLAPVGSKMEARVRGPNVTPGYVGDADLTRNAFDDEGYYKMGDAMRFVDPTNPAKGLVFDGRLAEDFKLSTGTWVSVGPLRTRLLQQAAGWAQDVVITGHDRSTVGALIFPNLVACRERAGLSADAPSEQVVTHPVVVDHFRRVLAALATAGTGSSTFPARAMLMAEPPSFDAREGTDKGSLNQKAVLAHRAALVDELYAQPPSARVLTSS